MINKNQEWLKDVNKGYAEKYGFADAETSVYRTKPGLTREVVEEISKLKNEPKWMLDYRLQALEFFNKRPVPTWGADLKDVDFNKMTYYLKPGGKQSTSWEDVPADIKKTFEKLGIPEAEKKFLAGVGAMYDSETIYHKVRADLEAQGVIFCDTDTALKEHEELFKKNFGTVVAANDNKFSCLNSAVWSGGS